MNGMWMIFFSVKEKEHIQKLFFYVDIKKNDIGFSIDVFQKMLSQGWV